MYKGIVEGRQANLNLVALVVIYYYYYYQVFI